MNEMVKTKIETIINEKLYTTIHVSNFLEYENSNFHRLY